MDTTPPSVTRCALVILWLVSALSTGEAALSPNATPEYILPCSRHDPNLMDCVRRAFDHLRPYLSQGIPEIKLQSLEPMKINKMTMDNGHGAVRVRAVFTNITVYGASNYTIIDVQGDVPNFKIDLYLWIPRIEVTGNYEVSGNVLLFPVRSRGDFWAMFSNVTGVGRIHGKEVLKGGVPFMKTERLGVDFKVGRARFRIRDKLNTNTIIGQAMNQFMNENANEIIEEMKPAAAQSIGKHFKSFLNGAFLQVPIPVWLKDT